MGNMVFYDTQSLSSNICEKELNLILLPTIQNLFKEEKIITDYSPSISRRLKDYIHSYISNDDKYKIPPQRKYQVYSRDGFYRYCLEDAKICAQNHFRRKFNMEQEAIANKRRNSFIYLFVAHNLYKHGGSRVRTISEEFYKYSDEYKL